MHKAAWEASRENKLQFLHIQKTSLNVPPFVCLILLVIILQQCALRNYIYIFL